MQSRKDSLPAGERELPVVQCVCPFGRIAFTKKTSFWRLRLSKSMNHARRRLTGISGLQCNQKGTIRISGICIKWPCRRRVHAASVTTSILSLEVRIAIELHDMCQCGHPGLSACSCQLPFNAEASSKSRKTFSPSEAAVPSAQAAQARQHTTCPNYSPIWSDQ